MNLPTLKQLFPVPKRHRYVNAPANSSKDTRPYYPRWMRRAIRGKNKKNIKRIAVKAEQQGYFLPRTITTVMDAINEKS